MTKRVTIEALAEWLRDRDDIALMGHISPDGDAVGCCLGLCFALRSLGKRAVAVLPGGVPKLYQHLPGAGEVVTTGEPLPFVPQTAFAVDVSDRPRLGDQGIALFDSCPHQAVMDHHPTNEGFGQVFVLDGGAAAAGELAVDLVEALGVNLTPEMAECLFVAISTDCGQFNYSNTRPQTFTAAAKCAAAGIDIERITSELYRTRTLGRTRLLGLALGLVQGMLLVWALFLVLSMFAGTPAGSVLMREIYRTPFLELLYNNNLFLSGAAQAIRASI